MPKRKFAHREKVKPKSIKSKAILGSKRKLSRFGKKQLKGHAGAVVEYIPRTRAVKKLHITLRDFRRLCILKGVYPRDPKKKPAGASQTYYHVKDIAYLAYEPLLAKFREFKTFMKRVRKAMNRHEHVRAKELYAERPQYTLDHIIKERYPRFADALGDMDDALSLTHLFAALPVNDTIKPERTASARVLAREWQYYVARSHSLRKAFLTVKGIYYQAEVKGVAITWLQPWQFAQDLPTDVDYRVMLTFLELHEVLLRFVHFKLFHGLGLLYPPTLRAEAERDGGHLSSVDVVELASSAVADGAGKAALVSPPAAAAAAAAAERASLGPAMAARLASVKDKLKQIAKQDGALGEVGAASAAPAQSSSASSSSASAPVVSSKRKRAEDAAAAARAAASLSMYDFVDADAAAAGDAAAVGDLEAFAGEDAEALAVLQKARALAAFQRLFRGLVFFLGREVPHESFEFMVCSFGGRVGWDGVGSPYASDDPRITHFVVDRPLVPGTTSTNASSRAETVQPQWIVDSINARMLLPVAKYARGAVLPPHLSPFVDDAVEGHTPAYRLELDRLRSAAAVTGRLADVLAEQEENRTRGATAAAAAGTASVEEEDDDEEGDDDDEDEESSDDDAIDEDGGDEEEEEEEEGATTSDDEDDDDIAAQLAAASAPTAAAAAAAAAAAGGSKKRRRVEEDTAAVAAAPSSSSSSTARPSKLAAASRSLSEIEAERRSLAAAMLSNKQRHTYDRAVAKKAASQAKIDTLAEKARTAAARGDTGLGNTPVTAPASKPAAAPVAAKGQQSTGSSGGAKLKKKNR